MIRLRSLLALSGILVMSACKKDDSDSLSDCLGCTSEFNPEPFEVCQNGDGNAVVDGEDTGTDYDVYLQGLTDQGAECN